jgi:hypothetical protein
MTMIKPPANRRAASSGLSADAGRRKAGHFVEESGGGAHQRPGESGARSLAEAQAEVEQRFGLQRPQLDDMARFRRAVAEDAVVAKRMARWRWPPATPR